MTSHIDKPIMGRPRIHDLDQIAKDLIEWAKLEDSINLNGFCCSREPPIPPSRIAQWARENENFCIAYESAKAYIGKRREIMLTEDRLHVKAYDLNASTYDFFLKQEKRDQAEFEANLSKEQSTHDQQADQRHQESMEYLKDIRATQALNKAESNISKA